ncbi:putative transposase [Escherichia coli 1-392-07_S3_C1]|nr:putative transposase [Escherichia coli 1-392-07_S3_C3]KDW49977.1 putative transposase [Escherichia coli 1-392-07_S3_C2]KDW96812.1 putative transposase [Escherichia coli 1-392-07_S3_C1]
MSSSLPDDINALKRLLAEQEALNRALLEKLSAFTAHRAGYRRTGAAGHKR